jgi:hypothetical protein
MVYALIINALIFRLYCRLYLLQYWLALFQYFVDKSQIITEGIIILFYPDYTFFIYYSNLYL